MYKTNINRARSLINETKAIFRVINDKTTVEKFRSLIMEENVLAIRALSTRDAAFRNLKKRYFTNNKIGSALIKFINSSKLSRNAKAFLIFYKTASADELIYDLTVNLMYNKMKLGNPTFRSKEILHYFKENEATHPEIMNWSINTRVRLAQHYLAIMKDFQFLKGSRLKILIKPRIPIETLFYVVFSLKATGIAPEKILQHNNFKLFLLNYRELRELLYIGLRENIMGNSIVGESIEEFIETNDLETVVNGITKQV